MTVIVDSGTAKQQAAAELSCFDRSECPIWVKSGHWDKLAECPLYHQYRTFGTAVGMSALCDVRTYAVGLRWLI